MTATKDVQGAAKRVLIVASNPAISGQTGWPIGFWWAELTHPYWEFVEHGYEVTIASPDGGALQGDSFSDPEDSSGYSAEDLISLGFIKSPTHRALIENTVPLVDVVVGDFDAVFLVGGQGPMYTFVDNPAVHRMLADFDAAGKPLAVVCHATCVLLTAKRADGTIVYIHHWDIELWVVTELADNGHPCLKSAWDWKHNGTNVKSSGPGPGTPGPRAPKSRSNIKKARRSGY